MLVLLLIWLGAIVATEAIVEIIVASKILFNFRDWLAQRSVFLGDLINCGYCVSVWVAAILFSYYLPVGYRLQAICADSIIAWLLVLVGKAAVVHRMSNVLHELFSRWFHKHRFGVELVHTFDDIGKRHGGQ